MDEAHGFGVLGEHGAGLAEELGVSSRIDFQMGTLSKAAGVSGGYVACSRAWADVMINSARSLIYSTAPPPALAAAALAAVEVIRSAEGQELRRACFRAGGCSVLRAGNARQARFLHLPRGNGRE